jgi:hypothetical protein
MNNNQIKILSEIRVAFQWTFENMATPHTADHFNVPANGIKALDDLIDHYQAIGGQGEDEAEKFFKSECDRQYNERKGVFSDPFTLPQIPFVLRPAIYKLMAQFAATPATKESGDAVEKEIEMLKGMLSEIKRLKESATTTQELFPLLQYISNNL